jgi:hypothetical protein
MAQTAEEEQNRATFLQMARVWFALAEREEARSSRNDHPDADSDEGGQLFRLKADNVSDRLRTAFR